MKKHNPQKHRLPIFDTSGILLVDKPPEWTSHDVVNFVRRRFNVPKVGHCGTLDPAATGLLVLVLGRFTKLSQKFSGEDKTYETRILLGVETDSQDMDGEVIAENDWSGVTEERFREVVASFVGAQEQIPPMVSAVKQDGKRLYKLARKGVEVEREPKSITIHQLDMLNVDLPRADLVVRCSKGTYVRALCADIGTALGCGGVLEALRRTESGNFHLEDAVEVDVMKTWEQDQLRDWTLDYLHDKLAKMTDMVGF